MIEEILEQLGILSPALLSNHIQIVLKESNLTLFDEFLCSKCDDIRSFDVYVELENEN